MPVHHVDVTGTPTPIPHGPAAAGGPIWIEIRPDLKRSAVIAGDVLAALGKRRDVAGIGRNAAEDVSLAIGWMRAYDITHLVATEAQRLTPLVLKHLAGLAHAASTPLWLLHRSPRSDTFIRSLQRRGAHPRQLDEIPAPMVRPILNGERPTLRVTLPEAGFHRFLTASNRTLSRHRYQRVSDRHTTTLEHCYDILNRDGVDIDVIARLVEQILREAPQDDLLVTDLRALQLAAWHHDLYLKSNLPQLLASPERQLSDPITVDQALVAYRQPHRAVAVGLAARQVGVTDIAALRLRDVRPDHTLMTRAGRPITLGEHNTRALRALVHLHTSNGRGPEESLLGVTARAISQALNDANTDLQIQVHGRRAERHVHPRRWLNNLGLTLHELP